jgi:hypothetical protein
LTWTVFRAFLHRTKLHLPPRRQRRAFRALKCMLAVRRPSCNLCRSCLSAENSLLFIALTCQLDFIGSSRPQGLIMSPPALGAKPDIVRTPPYHFAICDRLIHPMNPIWQSPPFDHAGNGRELTCCVVRRSNRLRLRSPAARVVARMAPEWHEMSPCISPLIAVTH